VVISSAGHPRQGGGMVADREEACGETVQRQV
jgi:hypothetical protein